MHARRHFLNPLEFLEPREYYPVLAPYPDYAISHHQR